MAKHWKDGLTPAQIRDIEMRRGAEVIVEKHDAAADIFGQLFNPDFNHRRPNEYNRQLAERNKKRWERGGGD